MKAVIFDINMNYLETIDGTFKDGAIHYNVGGFMGFFAEKKEIATTYNMTYKVGNSRSAYFIYNGEDYKQIALGNVPEKTHFSQNRYITSKKLAEYARDTALTKPLSVNALLEIGLSVLLIVIITITLLYANNLLGHLDQAITPFSKVANSTVAFEKLSVNASQQCYTVLNKTENLLAQKLG
jgi:hypothetical protein